jgi:2-phosphoglycerate kinase
MDVFWLGGSACAGKTSVARLLAAEHGLTLYSCDDHFEEHRRRADPARHPHFHRLMDVPMEKLWAQQAEVQAEQLLAFYADEWEMVLEDLAAIDKPALVEGVGLLPERIPEPHHALWLISTPEFRRRAYPARGTFVSDLLGRCTDPAAAFEQWMERDDRIARHLEDEARRRGLEVLTVDGTRSVEEMAGIVVERLGIR